MPKSYFQGYADSLTDSKDFIGFTRTIYNMVGRNAPCALILYRITYWHGTDSDTGKIRLRVESDGCLWLAKNYSDWEKECCVNESTARKALDRLESLGVIVTKIGKFGGKNTLFIRIIPEQFEYLSNMGGVSVQNGHLVSVQNGHLHIQDNTKEQDNTTTTIVDATLSTAATPEIPIQPVKGKSSTPKTTSAKPTLIVNQTNAALGRTPPPNFTPDEIAPWLKQKPVWELFANWCVWNIADGQFDDWHDYKEHVAPMQWDEIIFQVANMGKWLNQHAQKAKVALSYEWVLSWKRWYCENVMNDTIDKYPTTKDGFKRNFALYIDYLYQQGKQS